MIGKCSSEQIVILDAPEKRSSTMLILDTYAGRQRLSAVEKCPKPPRVVEVRQRGAS
jgi:hypothetical protein